MTLDGAVALLATKIRLLPRPLMVERIAVLTGATDAEIAAAIAGAGL